MKTNQIANKVILVAVLSALIGSRTTGLADQSESTISPSGDQFAAFEDNTDGITLSTSTVPTPICPDDTTSGPPTFYWDSGSDLDAVDNLDYSVEPAHPETLSIYTDIEACYHVTVYCDQQYISSVDESTYSEDTQASD